MAPNGRQAAVASIPYGRRALTADTVRPDMCDRGGEERSACIMSMQLAFTLKICMKLKNDGKLYKGISTM